MPGRRLGRRRGPMAGAVVTLALLVVCLAACGSGREQKANCPAKPARVIRDGFPEPPVRHSRDGKLETTLRASNSAVTLNGKRYITKHYEGSVPGPMLVFCPGDELVIHLQNDINEPTNLHVHGMHVSPQKNGDNVFLDIKPGKRFTYRYQVPEDHPPGAYWYHPHHHMHVEEQVFAGMMGPMVVEGDLDNLPTLRSVPVRNLVIHYTELAKNGRTVPVAQSQDPQVGRNDRTVPGAHSQEFVNGAINPTIKIRPGEVQRWRIFNVNDNPIVNLRLQGHGFQVLAADGNTFNRARPEQRVLIGPGERREVLVRGGPAGSYALESLSFSQFTGGRVPATRLATVLSRGTEREHPINTGELTRWDDLRKARVNQRHTVVFSEQEIGKTGNFRFLLNGKTFDPNRIDQTMKLGEVEEWTLTNRTTEWHTFHIHVNDFQVVTSAGRRVADYDPEDTVKLPPGKTVTMLTRPTDFTGKFVFHCHMLFHEDHGMMGVVRVVR